ncbi:MAG: bifunctional phosphoserine phosphatase/homoserine phosphotransferase ThrH [Bacteroidales bacterium]|nr:bifunctional phosphoserine phosphatase/homoserine phosphotransferase ThrH [Bacteroidales bacterium]MBN2819358.1 bifunctional phosphoserine phosphatase/homoserine phosphotransferase ThrH [Bacteroidales bacterium]
MNVICSDLEGVWVPEVWINVAKKTGIDELKLTTRDIKDYDELMQYRLKILDKHGLKLKDIQDVISTIKPLDGALEIIKWLQSITRLIIVSDTFVEFADPLMRKLDYPTLFCHSLEVDDDNRIIGYKLRQKDPKRQVVKALKSLNYEVIAFGDSYNDVSMLEEANKAFLYKPPQNVIDDFPQFPVATNYEEMKQVLNKMMT